MKIKIYDELQPITSLSKKEIIALGKAQAEEIIESGSSEQAYAFLHKVSVMIEEAKKAIKESAINEVRKGNCSAFGVNMSIRDTGKYSYKHDPKWVALDEAKKDYETLMKDKASKYLTMNMADENGELIDVKPAIKGGGESIFTDF